MKVKLLPIGLLPIPALLFGTLSWVSPASAQCVMTDVSTQVAIRGSRQPSQQENHVNMDSQGPCSGNAITQTSTQVYEGSGNARQIRNSRQTVKGQPDNGTGIDGPTIKVPVGVQVDVYSPAHDPDFMNRVRSNH
ncbi:MAG: hypothetical protein HC851_21185 [Acaryochloris sp. RU_4_1]|nr:hypothetical protein [Acaryochloris sp. RU_4_1]